MTTKHQLLDSQLFDVPSQTSAPNLMTFRLINKQTKIQNDSQTELIFSFLALNFYIFIILNNIIINDNRRISLC